MTTEEQEAIQTALMTLFRSANVPDQLETIRRNPVLLSSSAHKVLESLAGHADTPQRRARIDEVSRLLEAASGLVEFFLSENRIGELEEAWQRHAAAVNTLQSRLRGLALPHPGPAWAGAEVALARILTSVGGLGHDLTDPIFGPAARACAAALREAAAIFRHLNCPFDTAHALHERALLLHLMSGPDRRQRLEEGLKDAFQALRIFRHAKAPALAARSHHLIGVMSRTREAGDLIRNQERAVRHLALAWEGFRTAEDWVAGAESLYSSSAVWAERIAGGAAENFEVSWRCYRAARAIWKKQQSTYNVARSDYLWATNLAQRQQGRAAALEESRRLLDAIRRRLAGLPRLPAVLQLLANTTAALGKAHRERVSGRSRDNQAKAEAFFAEAVALTDRSVLPADWARHRLRQASMLVDRLAVDRSGTTVARVMLHEVLATLEATPDQRTSLAATYWEAVVAGYEGEWEYAAAAMSAVAKQRDSLLASQNRTEGAMHFAEILVGLVPIGTYATLRARGPAAALAFFDALRRGPGDLKPAKTDPGRIAAGVGAVVLPLVTPYGTSLLILRRASPDGQGVATEIRLDDVTTGSLNAILVPWIKTYWAWCAERISFATFCGRLDRQLRRLGRLIGGPLTRALVSAGVADGAEIVIIPTGALGLVPFHAMPIGGGRCFWDRYVVSYRSRLTPRADPRRFVPLAASSGGPSRPPAVIVTDPDESLGFPATAEARAVAEAFEQVGMEAELIASDDNPTIARVLPALAGRRYFHFIGHGVFDWEQPLHSGLLLADDQLLTAGHLLSGRATFDGCVCMLSACETALTDPGRRADVFVGLTQAFLDAGAASVTASLWPLVNDLTADLAGRFYAHHLGSGLDVPHALRAAAMDMRSRGTPAACWAALAAYASP